MSNIFKKAVEMNNCSFVGRLTKDPELKYTPAGKPVANFSIAVSRNFKAQDGVEADFFNGDVWAQQAEFLSQYGTKGRLVAVTGAVQIRSYVAQDGTKRYVTEIKAQNIKFLDRKPEENAEAQETVQPSGASVDDFADPFSE